MIIAGIDVYTDAYDHTIDFITNSVYFKHSMNPTSPENINNFDYRNSELRRWINTNILNALPSEWRDIIKPKKIYGRSGNNNGHIYFLSDHIWIPSIREIFGYNNGFFKEFNDTSNFQQYPLFQSQRNISEFFKPKYNPVSNLFWCIESKFENKDDVLQWYIYYAHNYIRNVSITEDKCGVVFGFRV